MVEIEICSVSNKTLCKIHAENNWSIAEVKKAVERCVPRLPANRQSIRNEPKGKDVKDSLTVNSVKLHNGTRLYVKDLGPQISWTAVFLAEYFGPLCVYSLFALRPSFIYGENDGVLTTAATASWICWSIHYSKRLFETVFIHRFSHGTMPVRNLFKNCSYYWGFSAFVAYHINHPLYTPPCNVQLIIGTAVFALCEMGNFSIHVLLRDLRPPGTTVRKIPIPNGNPLTALFNFVSCPNYTYEFGAWVGFTIMSSCIPAFLFALAGMYQMTLWALGKHKNYKKEFSDYPRRRKAIVPFIL